MLTCRSRPAGVVIGCKNGVAIPLVGQGGREVVTGRYGVGETDDRNESDEAYPIQDLQEVNQVCKILGVVPSNIRSGRMWDDR